MNGHNDTSWKISKHWTSKNCSQFTVISMSILGCGYLVKSVYACVWCVCVWCVCVCGVHVCGVHVWCALCGVCMCGVHVCSVHVCDICITCGVHMCVCVVCVVCDVYVVLHVRDICT